MTMSVGGSVGRYLGMVVLSIGLLTGHSARAAVAFSLSPAGVSNLYSGAISLKITGLTNGETVLVEKYLDLNNNKAIDATDWLVQSLRLTDGQVTVIGGVTNSNIPWDANPTNGSITANVSFPEGGFVQQVAGSYVYRLSSPSGRFTALTSPFTVTNLAYAQSFTGTVKSSGTNVPNAAVVIFTPPSGNNGMNPLAGTVANSSGVYTLKVPAGTYLLIAFRNGYLADLGAAPVLTLGTGATISTNLTLLPPTRTISGRVVDAANTNLGIPGFPLFLESTNHLVTSGSTDSNGNFSVRATASVWKFGGDSTPLALHGYLSPQDDPTVDATAGNLTGLSIPLPQGTALCYGNVTDSLNHPLPGLRISGNENDGSGPYRADATTDANGHYVMAVVAGAWNLNVSSDSSSAAGYVFSQMQGSTNLTDGQAVPLDFTGVLATNSLTGYVRDGNGTGIASVGVYGFATINGVDFNQYGLTDATGHYAFKVPNGDWNIGVNCGGGSDSLSQLGYLCVNGQSVTVSNNGGSADFVAPRVSAYVAGFVRDTANNPIVNVNVYAQDPTGTYAGVNVNTDGTGHYQLGVANGTWNVGVNCYGGNGSLAQLGYLCVDQQSVTVSNNTGTLNFTALALAYQITGFVKDSGGQPVANVNVNANASIDGNMYNVNGLTDNTGFYSLNVASGTWNVDVDCNGLSPLGLLCVNSQSVTISTANGTANFTALAAPYQISGFVKDNSGRPVTNLNVYANATISGTMYNLNSRTDITGFYTLSVANGIWNVGLDCNGLSLLSLLCANSQMVTISNANGAANFTVLAAPNQISGYVRDTGAQPITNVNVSANATINGTNYYSNTDTDGAGHYLLHVMNGSWNVGVNCNGFNGLNQAGYVCVNNQTVNIANNNTNVNFVAAAATLHITGLVRNSTNAPVTNVNVYANSGSYNASATTDSTGSYSLAVVSGSWDVNVDCNGLTLQGYACAPDQITNVTSANTVVNFTVQPSLANFQPLLTGAGWAGPSQFRFSLNTVSGAHYTVLYSTNNFASWFSWSNFIGPGGPFTVTDPSAGGRVRVYRVGVTP